MVQIVSNIITPAVLNASQIDTTTIADNSITDDKIVNGTIQNQSLQDYTIEPTKLALPTPVGDKLLTFDSTTGTVDYSTTYAHADTDDLSEGSTNLYYTNERVDDRVSNLLVAGSNITLTYDDVANTLTIDSAQSTYGDSDAIAAVEGEASLDLADDVLVGVSNIRDNTALGTKGIHIKIDENITDKWAGIILEEYGDKSFSINNPLIVGQVSGGTLASPSAVPSGKRVLNLSASARYGTGAGEFDTIAQIKLATNEQQSSTNRGGEIIFELNPSGGATDTKEVAKLRANTTASTVMDFDPNGSFGKTVISSSSTNGIEVDSATTFTDLLTLDPVDYGDLPSSPVRGSIAYLVNDGAGTFQNQPIYYEGSQWQYFADGQAVATS